MTTTQTIAEPTSDGDAAAGPRARMERLLAEHLVDTPTTRA
jgi:hypothetical protein